MVGVEVETEVLIEAEKAIEGEKAIEAEKAMEAENAIEEEKAIEAEKAMEVEKAIEEEKAMEEEKAIVAEKAIEEEKAESWVDNMTKTASDEPTQPVARPDRLGLGAKVARHSKYVPSDDPVERRLHAKLNAGKRKAAETEEQQFTKTAKDAFSSDEDDELESRTSVFSKKKVSPTLPISQGKKKQK
ncbi:hypothetical protein ACFE04_026574 [Oxalis oulophora]